MAAETTLALTLLKTEDHIIAFDDLYGGTRRLFGTILSKNFRIEVSYVDARDPDQVEKAIKKNTKVIWLESPTNPLMRLCDIQAISEIAKKTNLLVVVDNTFMSPYYQKPISLGADIVVHSTTKYLNGHSDSVGGAIMLSDENSYLPLKFNQNAMGSILPPFDSYLVLRGIKTLAARMKEHERNGLRIANYLEAHPRIKKVHYPGLASHPQYHLAKKQMSGFGGMLSFEIDGGLKEAEIFLESLRVFSWPKAWGASSP